MMPNSLDQSIRAMVSDGIVQATAALAEKYGFDPDEAQRFLDVDSLKLVRKRGPSPKKTEDKLVAKSKASPKSKKDEDKPKSKRGPTGYLLFAQSVRPTIKAEMQEALDEGKKLQPQDVVRTIAVQWQALTDAGKDEWNTKAKTPEVSEGEEEQ